MLAFTGAAPRRVSVSTSSGKKWVFHYHQVQIKHTKNFSIKNFAAPKTPPSKFFMFGLFPLFEGKRGPQTEWISKGQGSLGGSGRWVSGEILYVYALVNERQITHLIGAQPVLESYDVSDGFGHSLWRLHRACPCPKTYVITVFQSTVCKLGAL